MQLCIRNATGSNLVIFQIKDNFVAYLFEKMVLRTRGRGKSFKLMESVGIGIIIKMCRTTPGYFKCY